MATAKKSSDEALPEKVEDETFGAEEVVEAPVKKAAAKKVSAPAPVEDAPVKKVAEDAPVFSWVLDGTRYISTLVPEGIVARPTGNAVEVGIARRGGVWARLNADVDAPFRQA